MKPRTAAEKYLDHRRSDPEYAQAYETASRRVAMFDDVVQSLDSRRVELGLTKAELARRADMPAAAVRRLFSQQQKNPTLTTLIALADALDLRIQTSGDEGLETGATAHRSRQGPSEVPPAIAELADAWIETENRPDWTRLRVFLDYLALNPHGVERSLIRKPPRSKSAVLDAMLAGIAHKVAEDHGLQPPRWTSRVPSLKQEWLPSGTERMRSRWRELTPPQLSPTRNGFGRRQPLALFPERR